MNERAEVYMRDIEAFAKMMRDEPCELYAHALREAASGLFHAMTVQPKH